MGTTIQDGGKRERIDDRLLLFFFLFQQFITQGLMALIEPSALIKDVLSSFNGIKTTQTAENFIREKAKIEFSYWSMIGYSSHSSGAECVGVAKILKPWTTFAVRWFKIIVITVNKIKETSPLKI